MPLLLVSACVASCGEDGKPLVAPDASARMDVSPDLALAGPAGSRLGVALISGDFDGDGRADLAVGDDGLGEVRVFHSGAGALGSGVPDQVIAVPGVGFGRSLAAADVNGDGFVDLLVGSSTGAGAVSVFPGGIAGLDAVPAWYRGDAPAALGLDFGAAVARAGDVDGDGFDDVVIGAPGSDRAHLFRGSLTGLGAAPAVTWAGGGRFGAAVAGGSDLEGSGFDDVLVGAPEHDGAAPLEGAAHLFLGGAVLPGAASWTVAGGDLGVGLGAAVALGDLDADGAPEAIVGEPGARDPVDGWTGGVRLIRSDGSVIPWSPGLNTVALGDAVGLGAALAVGDHDGDGLTDLAVGEAGRLALVYRGGAPDLYPAVSVPGASRVLVDDLDGDGIDDLVVSDPDAGVGGTVAMFRGAPASVDTDADGVLDQEDCAADSPAQAPGRAEACDLLDADCDGDLVDGAPDADLDGIPNCADADFDREYRWTWSGPAGSGYGGHAAVGDVDGDGALDLLVGAPDHTVSEPGEGAVFVHRGPAFGAPSDAIWSFAEGAALGPVAVGDFDGDGYDDALVGLPGQRAARVHAGSADGPAPAPSVEITGAGDLGRLVSAVGDVNGDGFDDALVGATGEVSLHLGSAGGLDPVPVWTVAGADGFGSTAGPAGDVDGDGYPDLMVAAPAANGGNGAVYVYRGGAGAPAVVPDFGGVGTVPGGNLGVSLSAGDIDADGYSDIVAGGPGGDGQVVVFYGSAVGPTDRGAPPLTPDQPNAGLGSAVAVLDHNGDGYADVLVGASGAEPPGVILYLGGPEGLTASPVTVFTPLNTAGTVGAIVAGRLDADPYEDFVFGDPTGAAALQAAGTPDADGDLLADAWEWTVALDPSLLDSDGDGLDDGDEIGPDPLVPLDTDGDGTIDALDLDSDADLVADETDNCPRDPNTDQLDWDYNGLGDACDPCECPVPEEADTGWLRSEVVVTDLGLSSGFQDNAFGVFQRGRALVAADFDLDGLTDFFVGNPGDRSFVLRGRLTGGNLEYDIVQVLGDGHLSWGAAAADYDNDGDYDLFVSGGGNDCPDTDLLFRNEWIESGGTALSFTDVTTAAGVGGRVFDHSPGVVIPGASGGAVWVDYDRDGWTDLFVNGNHGTSCDVPVWLSRNTLWHNNGDGTFTDVAADAGLTSTGKTRHSTFFDVDNDGDLDLYEMRYQDSNILWRNELVETGAATFVDATADVSAGGADVSHTHQSFVSCAGDFDNDGWEDLLVVDRGDNDCHRSTPDTGPTDTATEAAPGAHRVYRNLGGTGFEDIGDATGINETWVFERRSVMGLQLGDLNMDGRLDVYLGNGGAPNGRADLLYLSVPTDDGSVRWEDASHLVDFPAPLDGSVPYTPQYPYRTHGTAIVDADGDGLPELAVANGGPAAWGTEVEEPNRLFKFDWGRAPRWLEVRPVGDGVTVSADAIGTRVAVTVTDPDGTQRTIHRTLFGGSCFSAQNGFALSFGLGQATTVDEVVVSWPDGHTDVITAGLLMDASMTVHR